MQRDVPKAFFDGLFQSPRQIYDIVHAAEIQPLDILLVRYLNQHNTWVAKILVAASTKKQDGLALLLSLQNAFRSRLAKIPPINVTNVAEIAAIRAEHARKQQPHSDTEEQEWVDHAERLSCFQKFV